MVSLEHCELQEDELTLSDWIDKMSIPEDLREHILKAKVVLVPQNFNKIEGVFLPSANELMA